MKLLRWFHLAFGLLCFVVFLITGQLMRADFPDKDSMDQMLRMLMRSRHIYILFASLIHLLLGAMLIAASGAVRRGLQVVGSLLLTLSTVLLVWAWFAETFESHLPSDVSYYGIFLALGGVAFHLFAAIRRGV